MDLLIEVYDLELDEFLLIDDVLRLILDLLLDFLQLKLHDWLWLLLLELSRLILVFGW